MDRILIVEDEAVIRAALKRLLERNSFQVKEAGSVADAKNNHDLKSFDLIISDLRLPGAPGTDLIKAAGAVPVLIMTSYASMQSAVESMKAGAVDYISKPFDHDDFLKLASEIIENTRADSDQQPQQAGAPIVGMVGKCSSIRKAQNHIHKIAPTDSTVLILGETGTGKELVARAIHAESKRADKALISVNCAAIPETLIESELFGYEKGAFTGANTSRGGLIEAANGGTLFLDEIGELPLEAQARLLRFIQEGEIRRIGSTESIKVDVRVISATHRNLETLSREGKFRQDLYYRINVLNVTLPPLRERGKDVIALADAIIARKAQELGVGQKTLSPPAIQALSTYSWPGNIRELENAMERALILCEDTEIPLDVLQIDLQLVDTESATDAATAVDGQNLQAGEELSLEDYFQRFVLEHQDQMSETELAQKLGVSRKCLWERRQRFGIPRKKSTTSRGTARNP